MNDMFLENIDNNIEHIEINKYSDLEFKEHKDTSSFTKNKKNIYCGNCGKKGHIYKKCHYPIISLGIICIKIDNLNLNDLINNTLSSKIKAKFNNQYKTIKSVEKYLNSKLKFLLIRRKHSLGFVEFIRGKYEFDNFEYLLNIMNIMSKDELELIKISTFNDLWNNLWNFKKEQSNNAAHQIKNHLSEYKNSLVKFNKLKEGVDIKFNKNFYYNVKLDDILSNIKSKWNEPEWGFPKGRRNLKESDLNCAIREFKEETNFDKDDYVLLNIPPSNEKFIGTNGIRYQHIYYLAQISSDKELKIDEENEDQICEIGDMRWLGYKEAYSKIREYNYDKKVKLENIYNMIKFTILYGIDSRKNIKDEKIYDQDECLFE